VAHALRFCVAPTQPHAPHAVRVRHSAVPHAAGVPCDVASPTAHQLHWLLLLLLLYPWGMLPMCCSVVPYIARAGLTCSTTRLMMGALSTSTYNTHRRNSVGVRTGMHTLALTRTCRRMNVQRGGGGMGDLSIYLSIYLSIC
jgi:hypothetical protein